MAIPKIQQEDFQDLPIINLIVERVASDFAGTDLLNGKLGYQTTSDQLQTVIAGSLAKILTSQDLAVGTDLVSATVGKLIDCSVIASSGDNPANEDQAIPSLLKVKDIVSSSLVGALIYQGSIAGNADLTGNATGNAYLDATSSVKQGDMFRVATDCTLTLSDGTIDLNAGDNFIILNSKADSALVVADIDPLPRELLKAIDVTFDNSNTNLSAINVKEAIEQVNAKHNNYTTITGVAFTVSENKTLTHNLNSTSIEVLYKANGSNDDFIGLHATNAQANTIDVQIDIAGTYDFIIKKLITA